MNKHQTATFRSARPAPPFWEVRFDAAHPPTPGCFVLADLGGPVREALFPAAVDAEGFAALVTPRHPVTRLLPATPVDLLGPLGHGFRLGALSRLLLVAEAACLPPLLPLLQAAPSVALVLEAPTRALLPPLERIPPTVELHLITQDGSVGHLGTLEQRHDGASPLAELLAWAEGVCFSCEPERYPALAQEVRRARLYPAPDFAQALVQVAMPCGAGACDICRVDTLHGERRACIDGPVFDILDF